MTNSEVYNEVYTYQTLRAKSGCAAQKKYWVSELKILRHLVDHQIIMNRGNAGKGKMAPELSEAYDDLRAGYTEAIQYVKTVETK